MNIVLNQKMHIAGAWMTEKSFAATPCSCHDAILTTLGPPLARGNKMGLQIENCIMASDKIMLNSKDFEGIYVPALKINCIFWINSGKGMNSHE